MAALAAIALFGLMAALLLPATSEPQTHSREA
jgi:hypothetical protein